MHACMIHTHITSCPSSLYEEYLKGQKSWVAHKGHCPFACFTCPYLPFPRHANISLHLLSSLSCNIIPFPVISPVLSQCTRTATYTTHLFFFPYVNFAKISTIGCLILVHVEFSFFFFWKTKEKYYINLYIHIQHANEYIIVETFKVWRIENIMDPYVMGKGMSIFVWALYKHSHFTIFIWIQINLYILDRKKSALKF